MADGASSRVYQLAVGDEDSQLNGTEHNQKGSMFFIDRLQFTASIKYSTEKTDTSSDETTFDIYNLNREDAARFKRIGATVFLRAGYDTQFKRDANGEIIPDYESLPVIYLGKIIYAYTVKKGVDKITKVICSSDSVERAVKKVSVSYAPKTKRADVVKDLVKQLGFSVLEMDLSGLGDKAYATGMSIYGSVSQALNRVCAENGLMWFTHNQQIRIVPADAKATNTAWEVWPFQVSDSVEGYYKRQESEQMAPAKTTHSRGKKPKRVNPYKKTPEDQTTTTETRADGSKLKTKVTSGLRFKTFLDGRLKLGDNVVIRGSDEYLEQMQDAHGQFRIIAVTHDLDFRGGGWTTELDLIAASENK